jgi:hypothetical protein
MTYERAPQVDEIITRLKGRSQETLKGMVDMETTQRRLGDCLTLMESERLSKADKKVAKRYIENNRALTEAEVSRVEALMRLHKGPPKKKGENHGSPGGSKKQ